MTAWAAGAASPVLCGVWPDVAALGAAAGEAAGEALPVLAAGVLAGVAAEASANASAERGAAPAGVAPAGDAVVGSEGWAAGAVAASAAACDAGAPDDPPAAGTGVAGGTVVWLATAAAAARLASAVGADAMLVLSLASELSLDPLLAPFFVDEATDALGGAEGTGVTGTPAGWLSALVDEDGAAALGAALSAAVLFWDEAAGCWADGCGALGAADESLDSEERVGVSVGEGECVGVGEGVETADDGLALWLLGDTEVDGVFLATLGAGVGVGVAIDACAATGWFCSAAVDPSSSEKKAPLPSAVEDAVPAPVSRAVTLLLFWAVLVSDSTVISCRPPQLVYTLSANPGPRREAWNRLAAGPVARCRRQILPGWTGN